jgi:hypothetical protein
MMPRWFKRTARAGFIFMDIEGGTHADVENNRHAAHCRGRLCGGGVR